MRKRDPLEILNTCPVVMKQVLVKIFYLQAMATQNQEGAAKTKTEGENVPGVVPIVPASEQETELISNEGLQIINLTDHELKTHEIQILQKDLTFSPMTTLDKFETYLHVLHTTLL